MAKRPVQKFDFKPAGQAIKEARKAHGDSRKKTSDGSSTRCWTV